MAPNALLKITLLGSDPLIWRHVIVPHTLDLPRLDMVLQGAMGWTNSHMHLFRTETESYGTRSEHGPDDDFYEDESKFQLKDMLPLPGDSFIYEYDMGDGWEHEVTLEKLEVPENALRHPELIDGENACPPEDCGGIYGYLDLLDILESPKHPEYKTMRNWLGLKPRERFDPTFFNIKDARVFLKSIKL